MIFEILNFFLTDFLPLVGEKILPVYCTTLPMSETSSIRSRPRETCKFPAVAYNINNIPVLETASPGAAGAEGHPSGSQQVGRSQRATRTCGPFGAVWDMDPITSFACAAIQS